jgi:hypothetical protein
LGSGVYFELEMTMPELSVVNEGKSKSRSGRCWLLAACCVANWRLVSRSGMPQALELQRVLASCLQPAAQKMTSLLAAGAHAGFG